MRLTAVRIRPTRRAGGGAAGIVLIEALATILILAFGMLSVASLQLTAMKYQKRSRALEIASEAILNITERARTNPAGVRAGAYRYQTTYAAASTAARTIDPCLATGTCTPAQTAENDVTAWLGTVRGMLPGGAVHLAPSGPAFVATVMWLDKDNLDESGPPSAALATAETCTAALDSTRWRNCCPGDSQVPAGVRCLRNYFLP